MIDEVVSGRSLKILLLEDVPTDAELELRELARAGILFESRVVSDRELFKKTLTEFRPDIILSDYSFPSGFNGLIALSLAREIPPDTPFIFVSGTIGEERAIESLKMGATDYILKNRPDRLPQAVIRAIKDTEEKIALRIGKKAMERDPCSRRDSLIGQSNSFSISFTMTTWRSRELLQTVARSSARR